MNHADRLPGLDLLRSVAIVWVMLFHSFLLGGLGPDWAWLSRYGWMGVDLFFVLSGFLIGTQVLTPLAHGGRLLLGDFYLRRALRILPAYWAVLLLYLLWPGWREAPGLEPAWKFLAFVVNLDIDYARNAAFSHAWSLCVEEHFYALFPALALTLLRRPSARRCVVLLAVLVLGGVALRTVLWLHVMAADPQFERSNWYIEDLYYPTWTRLDGLLCGVALAVFKVHRPQAWQQARRHANLSLVVGIAVLALAMQLFQDRVGLPGNAVGWPVLSLGMSLLVFAGAGRDSLIGRWTFAPAGWLAASSYSLYLVHKPVYHVVQSVWGDLLAGRGAIAFIAYGSAAVLAGAVLHLAVERPCLRLRRLATTRRPAQPGASTA